MKESYVMSRRCPLTFVTALSALLMMGGGGHATIAGDRVSQDELSFFGGGWDLNGPTIAGAAVLAPGTHEFDLDELRVEAVTFAQTATSQTGEAD
jgi:hypothetical protein